MRRAHVYPLAFGLVFAAACEPTDETGTDGGTTPDAGMCPNPLPTVATTCDDPSCSTNDRKTFAQAALDSEAAKNYLVLSWSISEIEDNANINVDYQKEVTGALVASRLGVPRLPLRLRDPARWAQLSGDRHQSRIDIEGRLRSNGPQKPLDLKGVSGTGIKPHKTPTSPRRQTTTCSQSAPTCGDTALCLIPNGQTDGTCETALTIKWRDQSAPAQFEQVAATVRRVGQFGAVVTDDADAMSDADIAELVKRFDEHIAPLTHSVFGQPRDAMGRDRDGNNVAIFFFTSKIGRDLGADYVGFFQATDLEDPATNDASNGADMLYLAPPSNTISLNQISGTVAHEYFHLINYYAKVIINESSQETVWLDEGLATFVEDLLGYGVDSFDNVGTYLEDFSLTSLTGSGLISGSPDSTQRRGMAMLLVRYVFEQAGGAQIVGTTITDRGGVAAVRRLVRSADIGVELFSESASGRGFSAWIGDLMTTVALDGTNYDGVSCNTKYQFAAPETVAYTNYPRGIDLRGTYPKGGQTVRLNGPATATFENESDIGIPLNGGEIRTLALPAGTAKIGIAGSTEYDLGFRVIPVGN